MDKPDIDGQSEFTQEDKSGEQEKEIPLCLRCAQPVDPLSHYCPNCGEATGQFTPGIPFVNLRMQVTFWMQAWNQVFSRRISIAGRCFRLFMIILNFPIITLAMPIMLWEKLKTHKNPPSFSE